MKQTDARALFPKHILRFSEGLCAVYEKGTDICAATVAQHDDKVVVGVMWLGSLKNPNAKSQSKTPRLVPFAEISSYRNVYEVERALTAERQFDGKGPATHEMAVKQFRKTQEQDFDQGIQMLAILIASLDDKSQQFTRQQYKLLTTNGKFMYRNGLKEQEAPTEAPVRVRDMEVSPELLAKASKLIQRSPVPQVAKTLHDGLTKRVNTDNRTTWNEEDDAIFALVEHDHKVLSDRLAQLHSARGSKISIPEFDRRRKAKEQNETC